MPIDLKSRAKSIEDSLSQTLADSVFEINESTRPELFEFPSLDDLIDTPNIAVQDRKDRNVKEGLKEYGKQLAWSFAETASVGLTKHADWIGEKPHAETLGGKIGQTIGTVGGFLVPMGIFSKAAGGATRAFSKYSGKKAAERLREPTKTIIGKGIKNVNPVKDPLSPLSNKQASKIFMDEIVEKELLKPLTYFGGTKTFKNVVNKNKFIDDTMQYAGEFLEQRAKTLGFQFKNRDKVVKELTDIYAKEITYLQGRPISEFRQQIARFNPLLLGSEGWIGQGLAIGLEEAFAFAAVEGAMHVVNVTGGFHQHDGTSAEWDELPNVLGQAGILGTLLGGGRLIGGGVKGGAIPNLLSKSGRDQMRAIYGYLPKFASKYNPVGKSINAGADRASLYNMHRHFTRIGDQGLLDVFEGVFKNHPMKLVAKGKAKAFIPTNMNIAKILTEGTAKQKDAMGIMLQDALKTGGAYMHRNWKPEFLSLLRKDLIGSQLRMGWGGMILGGGPYVLFDENILFEDKLIGFLTGYLLFKNGKELAYKTKGAKFVEKGKSNLWSSWDGFKVEYGETRERLRNQADMWSALGVEFDPLTEPWSSLVKKSREKDPIVSYFEIDSNLKSTERIVNILNAGPKKKKLLLQDRKEIHNAKTHPDWKKIQKDNEFQRVKAIHDVVRKELDNQSFIPDSANDGIRRIQSMSLKEYKQLKKLYEEAGWEDMFDVAESIAQATSTDYLMTAYDNANQIVTTSNIIKRGDERPASAIEKQHPNAFGEEYRYHEVPTLSLAENFKMVRGDEQKLITWYNRHLDYNQTLGRSLPNGGSKIIPVERNVKIERGDEGVSQFFQNVEDMKLRNEQKVLKSLDTTNEIMYDNSLMHDLANQYNFIHEASRYSEWVGRVLDTKRERTERQLHIAEALKKIFSVDDPNLGETYFWSLENHFSGYKNIGAQNQRFLHTLLPIIQRRGNSYDSISPVKRKKLDKEDITTLRKLFEAEGFSMGHDSQFFRTFSQTVNDLDVRNELKGVYFETGGYRHKSDARDRAVISSIYVSPLAISINSRNLRVPQSIGKDIDFNQMNKIGYDKWIETPAYQNLPDATKSHISNVRDAVVGESKITWEDMNSLQEILLPYIEAPNKKGEMNGWFRLGEEQVILSPKEYIDIIHTIKNIQRKNISEIEMPVFIRDLNALVKEEKSEYYNVAKSITELISKYGQEDSIHLFGLLKDKGMLDEQGRLGFKKNDTKYEDPQTELEQRFEIIKKSFDTKLDKEAFNEELAYEQRYENGELFQEMNDNPVKSMQQIFDKYTIGGGKGNVFNDKNDGTLRTDQLKDTFYIKFDANYDKFSQALTKEIKQKNENIVEDNLALEVVSVMKSMDRNVRVPKITVDTNARISNFESGPIFNSPFYQKVGESVGMDNIYLINSDGIGIGNKRTSAEMVDFQTELNTKAHQNDFVIINNKEVKSAKKGETPQELLTRVRTEGDVNDVMLQPQGFFWKFLNSKGGAIIDKTGWNQMASSYAKLHPKADLKSLGIEKVDGEWVFLGSDKRTNFLRGNEIMNELTYGQLLSSRQWNNVKTLTKAEALKQLKYFKQLKNDTAFIVKDELAEGVRRYLETSDAQFLDAKGNSLKSNLMHGLNMNKDNSSVVIIKDENADGTIVPFFSNKQDWHNKNVRDYPELYESNGELKEVVRERDADGTILRELTPEQAELRNLIAEDMNSPHWKDASWGNSAEVSHPDVHMAEAFFMGSLPQESIKQSGNKYVGQRIDPVTGDLEIVKTFGGLSPDIQKKLIKPRHGKVIAKLGFTSSQKKVGGEWSPRLVRAIKEIGSWRELDSFTEKEMSIPYNRNEYHLLHVQPNKNYIKISPDATKYYKDKDAIEATWYADYAHKYDTAEKNIGRIGIFQNDRTEATAWYRGENEKAFLKRAQDSDWDNSIGGLSLELSRMGLDPLVRMYHVKELLSRGELGDNIYKVEHGNKSSLSFETPRDGLRHQISNRSGIYRLGESIESVNIANKMISADAGDGNFLNIQGSKIGQKDRIVHFSTIKDKHNTDWYKGLEFEDTAINALRDLVGMKLTHQDFMSKASSIVLPEGRAIKLATRHTRHPLIASTSEVLLSVKKISSVNRHKVSRKDLQTLFEGDHDGDATVSRTRISVEGLNELIKLQGTTKDAHAIKERKDSMDYKDLDMGKIDTVLDALESQELAIALRGPSMQFPSLVQDLRHYTNNVPLLVENGFTGAAFHTGNNRYIVVRKEGMNEWDSNPEGLLMDAIKQMGQGTLDTWNGINKAELNTKYNFMNKLLFEGEKALFRIVRLDYQNNQVHGNITPDSKGSQFKATDRYIVHNYLKILNDLLTAERNDFDSGIQKNSSHHSLRHAVEQHDSSLRYLEQNVIPKKGVWNPEKGRNEWIEDINHDLYAPLKDILKTVDKGKGGGIYLGIHTSKSIMGNESFKSGGKNLLIRHRKLMRQMNILEKDVSITRQHFDSSFKWQDKMNSQIYGDIEVVTTNIKNEKYNYEKGVEELTYLGKLNKRKNNLQATLNSSLKLGKQKDDYYKVGVKDVLSIEHVTEKHRNDIKRQINRIDTIIDTTLGRINTFWRKPKNLKDKKKAVESWVRKNLWPAEKKKRLKNDQKTNIEAENGWVSARAMKIPIAAPKYDNAAIDAVSNMVFTSALGSRAAQMSGHSVEGIALRFDKDINKLKKEYKFEMFDVTNQRGGKGKYSPQDRITVKNAFMDKLHLMMDGKTEAEQIYILMKIMQPDTTTLELQPWRGVLFPTITEKGFNGRGEVVRQYIHERLRLKNEALADTLLKLYVDGTNESVRTLIQASPQTNHFTTSLGDYNPTDARWSTDYIPIHNKEEFIDLVPGPKSLIGDVQWSRMSVYERLIALHGTRKIAKEYIDSFTNVINAMHISLTADGKWKHHDRISKYTKMNSENRATVSSRANPENVLNQAVGMEAYHPTGLQSNRSYKQWGKDYYKKNVTEALLEGCIKDKKK